MSEGSNNHQADYSYLKGIPSLDYKFLYQAYLHDDSDEERVTREIYEIAEKIRDARRLTPREDYRPPVETRVCEIAVTANRRNKPSSS